MADARQGAIEAAARSQEVERRVARLATDLEALKITAGREFEAEMGRMRTEGGLIAARTQADAAAAIRAASRSARLELRRYASEQAVALAAQKITKEMSSGTDERLIQAFLTGIDGLASASAPGESDFDAGSAALTPWRSPLSLRSGPLDGIGAPSSGRTESTSV
jgi:F0F1-type ATP synthase membrane subunit b/b'